MKKLFIFLILGLTILSLKAQTDFGSYPTITNTVNLIPWDSVRVPVVDTVRFVIAAGNLSQYDITINFKMTGMDSCVYVHPGGSDNKLNSTVYNFVPIQCDSLPYLLSPTKWKKYVNGILQNIKSLPITGPLQHYYFAFKVTRAGCTPKTKYLKYQILYIKP
jgi:hypothetical protein